MTETSEADGPRTGTLGDARRLAGLTAEAAGDELRGAAGGLTRSLVLLPLQCLLATVAWLCCCGAGYLALLELFGARSALLVIALVNAVLLAVALRVTHRALASLSFPETRRILSLWFWAVRG